MKEIIISLALALALAALFLFGLNRQAAHECQKWQQQAEEYPDYYFTSWQVDQCEAVGLPLTK